MLIYDDEVRELSKQEKEQATYNSTGDYFQVHDILDLAYDDDRKLFMLLISWEGFADSENSWVSLDSLLEDIPTLVKAYLKGHKKNEMVIKVLRMYKGIRL
jgi:hypothetical protein